MNGEVSLEQVLIQVNNLRMLVKSLNEQQASMQHDVNELREEYVGEKKRVTLLHKRMLNYLPEAIESGRAGGRSLSMK
ncbi:hypothetical protein [Paraburkholderia tropica]|uniref:hypothetical protein n=1 Tax=Paraburkholderia tropica TaxID=92647 RepID=UPI003D2D6C4B